MAAVSHLPAWQARSAGLASTSQRHASPLTAVQVGGRFAAAAGGSSKRGRLPALARSQAVGLDGRQQAAPTGTQAGGFRSTPQQQFAQRQQQQQEQAPANGGTGSVGEAPAGEEAARKDAAGLELERRMKISHANKGRVPWNKGRRHPPETIARIRSATRAAMQRPEVREALLKANEHREPHTEEAKEKIRFKLRARAAMARDEILVQSKMIVDMMAASESEEYRECAQFENAVEVVAGLAWQYFKKDWDRVSTRGWSDHPEFQRRCIVKIQGLIQKKKVASAPRKRKMDKVKAALGHMHKLQEAQTKLAGAESALAKLQRAKAAFAGDPVRLRAAITAEERALEMLSKLRDQVARLELVLMPLQQYLEPEPEGHARGSVTLEQQLEADQERQALRQQDQAVQRQQQQQRQVQQQQFNQGPASSAAGGQGAPVGGHANGAVPSGSGLAASNGFDLHHTMQQQQQLDAGQPSVDGAAGAAAMPGRSALPWQQ